MHFSLSTLSTLSTLSLLSLVPLAHAACSPLNAILPTAPLATLTGPLDIIITKALPLGLSQPALRPSDRYPLQLGQYLTGSIGFFQNLTLAPPASYTKPNFQHGLFTLQNNQLYAGGGSLGVYNSGDAAGLNPLAPNQAYMSADSEGAVQTVEAVMYCRADGTSVPVLAFPVAVLSKGSFLVKKVAKGQAVFAPPLVLGINGGGQVPVIAELVQYKG